MKTVMKKMFCLLLVAVLLVGVMPFAAFADGEGGEATCEHERSEADYPCRPANCIKCGEAIEPISHDYADATCTTPKKCKVCGSETGFVNAENHDWADATCRADKTCKRCSATVEGTKLPHDRAAATCTTPSKCKVCGSETGSANGHTEVIDAAVPVTCTTDGKTEGKHCSVCNKVLVAQETIKTTGHEYGTGSICATCNNCKICNKTINKVEDHDLTCKLNPNYESTCDKCGEKYLTANGHKAADCKVCLVCWDKGDTGVRSHKTSDHCATCKKLNGHEVSCPNYSNKATGSSKVKVYVNLYTSDVKTETVHLYTYENVASDTPVYAFIAEQSEHIRSLLPSGYTWGGNVYDSQNDDDAELMKGKVGKGTTVHINAYSAQDLVYIYVHNSRSFSNLRIVQLHGKKVGETITKKEVTKAVSKYFNVSGLSMYDEQAWEDYVDGASVESVASLKITNDPYFIDVRISGTAKSGTSGSGYTADSSNPKTGDAIFAPVMILGLSASALAVLFYLNKKRAF